jgi:hypothetical protein
MTGSDGAELLAEAGWSPNREVDVAGDIGALRADGYPVWESLARFFAQFSGITVRYTRNGRADAVWFGGGRAVAWADAGWVEDYAARVGQRLAPVGYAHHDHLLVMAAEDGKFFGGYDDVLVLLGSSPPELVGNLAAGQSEPVG